MRSQLPSAEGIPRRLAKAEPPQLAPERLPDDTALLAARHGPAKLLEEVHGKEEVRLS